MIRGVGLRSAVAINVVTMVGAGPFITLPLVVVALHGSVSAVAWVAGAVIAACDGLVWAELASRFPRSGGTYVYLREAFGPQRAGRFVAFLFIWQFLFWAPLVIASGYIGFAQYAAYLVPAVASPVATHLLAAGVGIVTLAALYRGIPAIARTALVLGAIALATLVAVAVAGFAHPYAPLAHTIPMTLTLAGGVAALGPALVLTLYDYGGYADVCALGDEVIAPTRTIPRAVVLSVAFVAAAYVLLNLGVAVALAPSDIMKSSTIASVVAERAFGAPFAVAVTIAVMVTAFASTYGLLLASSRVPYAAALDGDFLAPFARLHRNGRFPAVSLVTMGLLALPASLLPLDVVIAALTAGIVLVQGVGQIVALAVVRATKPNAPFRVPLYPLPPLLALAGWLFLFASTGAVAIAFGLATLCAGAIVYLVRARITRIWPFAAAASAVVAAMVFVAAPAPAAAAATASPAFGHAVLARDAAGEPMVRVDGKPFFFLGGAFFYERIPRSEWPRAMRLMRGIGANTLDLYVPWNWHELADGDFDFTGRTSPRRDLREVLRLGKAMGFHFIVRPGPVIRNEWRNGGYPAWLLQRPEYGMPLHDVLEGRYPATATLQNAHSDAAAAEWMRNRTHRYYAARWLHRALAEFRPVADRVIAVQLDDDQGAYLDNDTYPAPHLHVYLRWLEKQVRDVVGPRTPVFINTFEMKVPSSSPVWAMGNWYQSDAFSIGEHDRAELAFATSALRTQRDVPLAYSEFQAGWLAGPEDPEPRPADPTNTTLALGELTGLGLKGLIDFPLHDTLAPFGWEAPFSNAFYNWDAAFDVRRDVLESDVDRPTWSTSFTRLYSTRRLFGALALYGPALEEAHRVAEIAIAYDGRSNAFAAAHSLKVQLGECRRLGITCDTIDASSIRREQLSRIRFVVAPRDLAAPSTRRVASLGVRILRDVADARDVRTLRSTTMLRSPHATFAVVENWSAQSINVDPGTFGPAFRTLRPFVMPPRDARIVVASLDLHFVDARYAAGARLTTSCAFDGHDVTGSPAFTAGYPAANGVPSATLPARCEVISTLHGRTRRRSATGRDTLGLQAPGVFEVELVDHQHRPADPVQSVDLAPGAARWWADTIAVDGFDVRAMGGANARRADVFQDGQMAVVLENPALRAVVVPDAGGRIVSLGPSYYHREVTFDENVFDATGALRDDVLLQQPPSRTDRIAKYTHTYPAGMFNRPYRTCMLSRAPNTPGGAAGAYLAYDAPDVAPAGARFERVLAIGSDGARVIADVRFTPHGNAGAQRLVEYSAIAGTATTLDDGITRHPSNHAAVLDSHDGGVAFIGRFAPYRASRVFVVAWRPGDVAAASWQPARSNGTLRLVFAPGGWRRLTFASAPAPSEAAAQRFVQAERGWVAANPAPPSEGGEVAKRYTQSPQKRPSESSCGFESHLPQ